jgi:septum formation topological specificity factor MinE
MMGWFNFGRKKASRDVALKRMQSLVGSRRENISNLSRNTGNVAVVNRYDVSINTNEITKVIRDYVRKKAKIDDKNVKVHISKDENGYTIVTNIFFR